MSLVEISYAFHECKNFENRLRFDKVTESLKVGTFVETQCTSPFDASIYLKINSLWQTVISSSMGYTPKYLQISL